MNSAAEFSRAATVSRVKVNSEAAYRRSDLSWHRHRLVDD